MKTVDINFNAPTSITEGGVSLVNTPKQAKGGVFAPADIALIKRALDVYRDQLVRTEESERTPSAELSQLANLLHRLNNRI